MSLRHTTADENKAGIRWPAADRPDGANKRWQLQPSPASLADRHGFRVPLPNLGEGMNVERSETERVRAYAGRRSVAPDLSGVAPRCGFNRDRDQRT